MKSKKRKSKRQKSKRCTSGVYMIRNKANGKVYIGESGDINQRWDQHRQALENGNHANKYLQGDYNEYGKAAFDFSIIHVHNGSREVPEVRKAKLLIFEHYYVDYYKSTTEVYNIRDSMVDVLMDANKYMSDNKHKRYISAVKNRLIDLLRNTVVTIKDGKVSMTKAQQLKDVMAENEMQFSDERIEKLIKFIPKDKRDDVIREVKYEYKNHSKKVIVHTYLVTNKSAVNKYIKEFKSSSLYSDTISLTKMYQKLINNKFITRAKCSLDEYKKILRKNNLIELPRGSKKARAPHGSEYTKNHPSGGVSFTSEGIKKIEEIFSGSY